MERPQGSKRIELIGNYQPTSLRPSIQQLKFIAPQDIDVNLQKIQIEGRGLFDNVTSHYSVFPVQNCPLNRAPRQNYQLPLVYPKPCTDLHISKKSSTEKKNISLKNSSMSCLPHIYNISENKPSEAHLEPNFLPSPYKMTIPMQSSELWSKIKYCSINSFPSGHQSVINSTQTIMQARPPKNSFSGNSYSSHSDLKLNIDSGMFYNSTAISVNHLMKENWIEKRMENENSPQPAEEVLKEDLLIADQDNDLGNSPNKKNKTEENSTTVLSDKYKISVSDIRRSFGESAKISHVFSKDCFINKIKTKLDLAISEDRRPNSVEVIQEMTEDSPMGKWNTVSGNYSFIRTNKISSSRKQREKEDILQYKVRRISCEDICCQLGGSQRSNSEKISSNTTRSVSNPELIRKSEFSKSKVRVKKDKYSQDLNNILSKYYYSDENQTSTDLCYKEALEDSTISLRFAKSKSLSVLCCHKSTQIDSSTSLLSFTLLDKETQINCSNSLATLKLSNSDLEIKHNITDSEVTLKKVNESNYQMSSNLISEIIDRTRSDVNFNGSRISNTYNVDKSASEFELSVFSRICDHFTDVGVQVELGLEPLSYLRQNQ